VKSIWLKAGETANVRFANTVKEAGEQQAQAGGFTKKFTVLPKPAGRPVSAPYLTFQNTTAEVQQFDGGGFYIRDSGDDPSVCCIDRADTYAAIYQKGVLPLNGTVVTRLENADLRSSWAGLTGIMVRNDISKAGQSGGYVVLGASPASGYIMLWDSNGDGRMDNQTELDGYTYWPGWLKMERRGSHFTGYYSKDGSNWTKVGEVEIPSANERLDAGLFARLSSARFDGFNIEAQPGH
jgi:hypothetical protein